MFFISGDCVETFSHIQRLGCSELMQLPVYAQFGLFARRHWLFQPFKEPDKRHAIPLHCVMDADDLLLIANGFQQCHRRFSTNDLACKIDSRINRIVRFLWVDKYVFSCKRIQERFSFIIFSQADLLFLQVFIYLLGNLLRRNKVDYFILSNQ